MSVNKMKITDEMFSDVLSTGKTMNAMFEEKYPDEIKALREVDNLKNLSATKLALVTHGISGNDTLNAIMTTEESEYLFPAYMGDLLNTTMANSVDINNLIGGTMGVDTNVLKLPTVDLLSDDNKKAIKKARIEELAEFPRRTIKIGQSSTELYKKGVAFEQSYEAARRMKINLFDMASMAVAGDIVQQNIIDAIVTLEGTKLNPLKTTAAANKITGDELYDAIIDYYVQYKYMPTTIVADTVLYKEISKIMRDTSTVFGVNDRISLSFPGMENGASISVVHGPVSTASSKNRILMYNKQFFQKIDETGATLTEYDKFKGKQSEVVYMSEVSGFNAFVENVGVITSA